MRDDEHAAKADQERRPARSPDRFLKHERRSKGGKQRRRKVDGNGARKRHHRECEEQESL